jgi:cellulose synthase/poly-beta-1,6-N-acetylglucosamine synthase-like glycosyltransferase
MQLAASLLNLGLLLAGGLLALPVLVLLVQVLAARRPAGSDGPAAGRRPPLALLVPAHDEEGGIASTLAGLRAQMAGGDRLVVVADNCSDRTAELAAAQGAEVVVRHDTRRRGKGYALDRGMQHLAASPPEVVVIVDADCEVAAGGLDRLARACVASGRPVQALYLMQTEAGAGLRSRIGEFAWHVKNHARPLGNLRLGLPCQLMGTGMAFPWAVLAGAPLASGSIVEDMQLGLDLARAGSPPLFCPEALVTSRFAANAEGQQAQRTRWEHGHVALLLAAGPRLLWLGLRRGRADLVALALDLCVPPLASLALAIGAYAALALLAGWAAGLWLPLMLALALAGLLTLAVLLAWQRHGRGILSIGELLAAPLYALSKLPFYLRLLWRRQTEWVRTRRDGGGG